MCKNQGSLSRFYGVMMRSILLVVIALLLTAPAQAATSPSPSQPEIRPVYRKNGALRFCLADSLYTDGRKISFAYAPKDEINLGLTIPQGNFQKTRRYDLDFDLEGQSSRKVRAIALSNDTLLLEMGARSSFLKNLEQAPSLSVGSGSQKINFALPYMPPLLEALQLCAKGTLPTAKAQETNQAETPSAAAAPKPEATRATPQQPQDEKEVQDGNLPPKLRAFLESAGLEDVTAFPMDDVPQDKRVADFVWETGNVLGGIRKQTVPQGHNLSKLIGLHLKGLKKKCSGDFNAEIQKEQTAANALLRFVEASCAFEKEPSKPTVIVALVFSLTPERVFTVFTHEGLEKDKPAIISARNKIGKRLLHPPF